MNDEPAGLPPLPPPPSGSTSVQTVMGGVLMGCGILVAGLSGLCTLLVTGTALIDTSTQDAAEFASMIPAVLVFGGIPLAIGVGIVFLGRYLMKTGRNQ